MGDLKTNAFEFKLEELMVSMKFLEVLQPFLSFLDGFGKKKGSQYVGFNVGSNGSKVYNL
jgi:hypothetical protein